MDWQTKKELIEELTSEIKEARNRIMQYVENVHYRVERIEHEVTVIIKCDNSTIMDYGRFLNTTGLNDAIIVPRIGETIKDYLYTYKVIDVQHRMIYTERGNTRQEITVLTEKIE